jgi:hypothetical protein
MPTFPTPQPISVVIGLSAGDVRIHATDRENTVVKGRPADPSRPSDVRAAEHVRVLFDRGELRVAAPRANASVVAKNAYGSVRIGEAVRESLLLESSYGTLEAGIAPGTAAWLDLSTQHGTVRNELTTDSGPRPSDETVEVRARNSWGDILIRRSSESPAETDSTA